MEPSKSEWDSVQPLAHSRKWDATPLASTQADVISSTPKRKRWDATPISTDVSELSSIPISPAVILSNAPAVLFSTDELDDALPSVGFVVLDISAKPPFDSSNSGYFELNSSSIADETSKATVTHLLFQSPEDFKFFEKLVHIKDKSSLSIEEAKEIKLLQLLLKLKNGEASEKKYALKTLLERATEFDFQDLMTKVLILLSSSSILDHQRHLLVKLLDRLLLSFPEKFKPFTDKMIHALQPFLVNENYFIRAEGREMISNISKAVGAPLVISALRSDIEHQDEGIRNNACRIFGIVALTLGVNSIFPFIRAACSSRKNWQVRHSSMKIIQQIAVFAGNSCLPFLRELIECVGVGLNDEIARVKTMAALAVASLVEISLPNSGELYAPLMPLILTCCKVSRGRTLSAFIKALGSLIPVVSVETATLAFNEVAKLIFEEAKSSDDETKRIALKFLSQSLLKGVVSTAYLKSQIFNTFLSVYWTPSMASEKGLLREIAEVCVLVSRSIGAAEFLVNIFPFLKGQNDPLRKMSIVSIDQVFEKHGVSSIDQTLQNQLFDGLFFAFQEFQSEEIEPLRCIGSIFNRFEKRTHPFLPQITNIILWHLANRSARIRNNAARLITELAKVISLCDDAILVKLCSVLYENLGEEYPDVLANIIKALSVIIKTIGVNRCSPSINDITLRVSPILRNRHDKVQEAAVEFIGTIASKAPESVSAREWMRICFELLELLRSPRKTVRRNAVLSFGVIAKAIGPHDILAALLNNLKVQERQNRICTTIAIAIVAESCSPFTVIPALMNEYRVPELNVQNGVLKAISYLLEYIGEMSKDYIFAITPLLEDALVERDLVHRQISSSAIRHLSLGVSYFGCEDALVHLLNLIWPNIFETSSQIINSIIEAIESLNLSIGSATVYQYSVQGLFHPARRIRDIYWRTFNNCYLANSDSLVPFHPPPPPEKFAIDQAVFDVFI